MIDFRPQSCRAQTFFLALHTQQVYALSQSHLLRSQAAIALFASVFSEHRRYFAAALRRALARFPADAVVPLASDAYVGDSKATL